MSDLSKTNTYAPEYLVAPGEIVEEYLEALDITQANLAERTGLTRKTINEIVKGKAPITPETAIKFERVFRMPAHFWENLEANYQHDKARLDEAERLSRHIDWLQRVPLKHLVKRGWIKKYQDKHQQLDEVLKFFGIDSPDRMPDVYGDLVVAFRQAAHGCKDDVAIAAWLRQGEIQAKQLQCDEFDKKVFLERLHKARALTTKPPEVFQPALVELFAPVGVAVVFVPELPNTGISGCTRWVAKKAIMQLSLRYKSNDHLWFTVFHEAGHILKHGKKDVFFGIKGKTNIHSDNQDQLAKKEEEANQFAQDFLIPAKDYKAFLQRWNNNSFEAIKDFAEEIGIAPGIVVGRLQHDNHLSYAAGNHLKVSYRWEDRLC